jgi:hypothetical protein
MSLISDIQEHIEELKSTTDSTLAIKLEEKVNAVLEFQMSRKLSQLLFTEKNIMDSDISFALHLQVGSITVLDRMTGFSFGRDIETGFRDPYGKFWLASGNFDIRTFEDITVREAIEKIKENANTCQG